MGIKLTKGQNVALDDGLKDVRVGLGCDAGYFSGGCFMLAANGKVRSEEEFDSYIAPGSDGYPPNSAVYEDEDEDEDDLPKLKSRNANNAVAYTYEGDDDSSFLVQLDKVPADIQKIAFTGHIDEDDEDDVLGQNFGHVTNAFIRIVDNRNNEEVARFYLSEDASTNTAMIFGELYRKDGKWKFRAVGQGFAGSLPEPAFFALCKHYGIDMLGND